MVIQMTRAEYEAKYGTPPPLAPIKMTRAEYEAKYTPVGEMMSSTGTFSLPKQRPNLQQLQSEAQTAQKEAKKAKSVGGFLGNFGKALVENIAPSQVGLGKTIAKTGGNQSKTYLKIIEDVNTQQVNLLKAIREKQNNGGDTSSLKRIYNDNVKQLQELNKDLTEESNLPTAGKVTGQLAGTALDTLTAGTFSKAKTGLMASGKIAPSVTKATTKIATSVGAPELGKIAQQKATGLFTKQGAKNIGTGVGLGYANDVTMGLQGSRGEDRTGAGAFIPGIGTAIGATIPAISESTQTVKNLTNPEIKSQNIINKREKALSNLDKYQTIRKATEKGNQRGIDIKKRLAQTDVLNGAVDKSGNIATKGEDGAVAQYTKQFIEGNESLVSDLLKKENRSISPDLIKARLTSQVKKAGIEGKNLTNALKAIDDEVAGYMLRADDQGNIPVSIIHDAKIDKYNGINFFTEGNTAKYDKTVAKALKEIVEETTTSADIKKINQELSKDYAVIDYLKKLDNKKVDGGKLGKYFAQTVGAIVGSKFGPLGAVVGAETGGVIKGNLMSRTFNGQTKKAIPQSEVITEALKVRDAPALMLPQSKSNNLGSLNTNQSATISPTMKGINESLPKTAKKSRLSAGQSNWSRLQKDNPDLFNTGILRKQRKPQGAVGDIPVDVHLAQSKWQNYGQYDVVPASRIYDNKDTYANYLDEKGNRVGLQDEWDNVAQEWIEPTIPNQQLKQNLIDSFSTPEGNKYLKEVVKSLPKNPDGSITAYRVGNIGEGEAQSFTLSEGMAKTFSNQGTDVLPAGTPGLPTGGYKNFGVLPARMVKIDPEGIVAWSPYDAEILVEKKFIKTKSQLEDIWEKTNNTKSQAYTGEKDLTTKILKDLEGKTTVSKQYILDATNRPEIKQTEKDITRKLLEDEGDTIKVADFAKKVKSELLPLKKLTNSQPKYEKISLPDELKGNVKNYTENIYSSPIKTSAGQTHFGDINGNDNYFGHTRIEDMADNKTRRVIEVQSDLYQKGNLEREIAPETRRIDDLSIAPKFNKELIDSLKPKSNAREVELSKLRQYNNPTAHFRMVREEIKKASQDGKNKLQFPTGETAMKIEGLGDNSMWLVKNTPEANFATIKATPDKLSIGQEITRADRPGLVHPTQRRGDESWIITDVLGDGKFKAVPKTVFDDNGVKHTINSIDDLKNLSVDGSKEQFDISGKVDTNNPIYRFYEKDLGRYLKSNYNAKLVSDDQGVNWYEMDIDKKWGDIPTKAFVLAGLGLTGVMASQEDKKVKSLPKNKK